MSAAKVSVRAPLERLLVCIWVKRWVGISGRMSGGRAMDRVCDNLTLVRSRL